MFHTLHLAVSASGMGRVLTAAPFATYQFRYYLGGRGATTGACQVSASACRAVAAAAEGTAAQPEPSSASCSASPAAGPAPPALPQGPAHLDPTGPPVPPPAPGGSHDRFSWRCKWTPEDLAILCSPKRALLLICEVEFSVNLGTPAGVTDAASSEQQHWPRCTAMHSWLLFCFATHMLLVCTDNTRVVRRCDRSILGVRDHAVSCI